MQTKKFKKFVGLITAAALAFSMTVTSNVSAASAAEKTTVTVSTQKELREALKSASIKQIKVSSSKLSKLSILQGDYSDKKLVINAKNAKVVNAGSFESITVKNADTFTEKAENNKISLIGNASLSKLLFKTATTKVSVGKNANVESFVVRDVSITPASRTIRAVGTGLVIQVSGLISKLSLGENVSLQLKQGGDISGITVKSETASISVAAGAKVDNIKVTADGAALNVNAVGAVAAIQVSAKAEVAITGSLITPIEVSVTADGAKVESGVPLDVTANANVSIKLNDGAEGSKIKESGDGKAAVENGTKEAISVTDASGKENDVNAGASYGDASSDNTSANSGSSTTTNTSTTDSTASDNSDLYDYTDVVETRSVAATIIGNKAIAGLVGYNNSTIARSGYYFTNASANYTDSAATITYSGSTITLKLIVKPGFDYDLTQIKINEEAISGSQITALEASGYYKNYAIVFPANSATHFTISFGTEYTDNRIEIPYTPLNYYDGVGQPKGANHLYQKGCVRFSKKPGATVLMVRRMAFCYPFCGLIPFIPYPPR